jgi:hypothetical protein
MTKSQAKRLMEDLGNNLLPEDYRENVYISVNGVGTEVFKNCAYFEAEGYSFIWTETEKRLLSKKEMGNYALIPYDPKDSVKLKKVV